ncbi:hypothetical protein [Effusibacillus dendaii]|uniref:DUF2269 family protein n=1 Tax=Effusibacillus dendaii TaxID=2743772 RepID=A0A7I8D9W5_9BACL|nr:hypothetical protein [Effusibacillus dendaii]BCJ86787.1 hypothetical protein skT53_17720 [Effusibacillus dendaii]
MRIAFYIILAIHLSAVAFKLALLFRIPRLKNKSAVQAFLVTYKKWDAYANWSLWITGAAMVFTTSLKMLLQPWLQISILIYVLIFWLIKIFVVKSMEEVAASKKVSAIEEMRLLRFQNLCVGITVFVLLMSIGTMMMTKPFGH